MKRLFLSLILTLGLLGCSTSHEMQSTDVPPSEDGFPGIELPDLYNEAFGIVYEEWLVGGLADGVECTSRWSNTRLLLQGWDDFEASCGGPAWTKKNAGLVEPEVQTYLGCTGYNPEIGKQLVSIDAGMSDVQKMKTFMHEVIHILGSCSFYQDADGDHDELYWWKIVLAKAEARVVCNEDTNWQTQGRNEPYCLFGDRP